jgi:hypothetical protein
MQIPTTLAVIAVTTTTMGQVAMALVITTVAVATVVI